MSDPPSPHHAHGHHGAHASSRERGSVLAMSAGGRLLIVIPAICAVWLAILWARL